MTERDSRDENRALCALSFRMSEVFAQEDEDEVDLDERLIHGPWDVEVSWASGSAYLPDPEGIEVPSGAAIADVDGPLSPEFIDWLNDSQIALRCSPREVTSRLTDLGSVRALWILGADDACLAELKRLRQLRSLHLQLPSLTEIGVAEVAKLRDLRSLTINHATPSVSDSAIAELSTLAELRSLALTEVTDAGMAEVSSLVQLRALDVGRGMTDAAVPMLSGLSRLRALDLGGTEVSDAAMEAVSRLSELRSLSLGT